LRMHAIQFLVHDIVALRAFLSPAFGFYLFGKNSTYRNIKKLNNSNTPWSPRLYSRAT